ncbi:protein kinase C-binding protein 1-like [Contarinia nasturtii]|uniref:protein kinase C-binding protein 1-like n=1 Tax=Contarinia nasturtii TaxID=265458 RepID=UPI0012D3E882|nr:protein kinase C-binding protein 1-like [Contarinia nasturtii]
MDSRKRSFLYDDSDDDTPLSKRKNNIKKTKRVSAPNKYYDCPETATSQIENTKWDEFCWHCKTASNYEVKCSKCVLSFHMNCMPETDRNKANWTCPECRCGEKPVETSLNDNDLDELLKCAVERIGLRTGTFIVPKGYVDSKLLKRALTFEDIVEKANNKTYSNTHEFIFDFKLLLHCCTILKKCNKADEDKKQLAETREIAKKLHQNCIEEVKEFMLCGDCYIRREDENAFTQICSQPHLILWVKFESYPYWPAKLLKVNKGRLEVYFFKDHNTACVLPNDCFLFSKEDPNVYCTSRFKADVQVAVKETEEYAKNIETKFGTIRFAPKFTKPSLAKLNTLHLDDMIPGFRNPAHQMQNTSQIDGVNGGHIDVDSAKGVKNPSFIGSSLQNKPSIRDKLVELGEYISALEAEYNSQKATNEKILKENALLKAELALKRENIACGKCKPKIP